MPAWRGRNSGEIGSGGTDNHLGDTAREPAYDRELGLGPEEGAATDDRRADRRQVLAGIEDYGNPTATCQACGEQIGADRLRAIPWARPRHRRSAARGLSESQQAFRDVRVGRKHRTADPLSVAERRSPRACGSGRGYAWRSSLAAVIADQVTKHVVTTELAGLDESARCSGRPSIHRTSRTPASPSGCSRGATAICHARSRLLAVVLDARVLRRVRRAPPGAACGARPADRRQPLEPASIGCASAT